jgi:hypothetical protein
MSRKSGKKSRQQNKNNDRSETVVTPPKAESTFDGNSRAKRMPWYIPAIIVVSAVVLFALTRGGGSKSETTASATNRPPSATVTSTSPGSATGLASPKIQFATQVHDFGQIKGGEAVKFTYFFTNIGGSLLEISNVQPACGCTTAGEWSRKVEAGQTGSIAIQFNSGDFSGHVGKTITVTCNDPTQTTLTLQINGTIWKPIEVTPLTALLNITAEMPSAVTTVHIVNNEEAPLTLSAPEGDNPAFAAELKTNQPGKEFDLVIKALPAVFSGGVQGQFTLKTSSTNLPVVKVTAFANLQRVIAVTPLQITLPAAPLTNSLPVVVFIRNNGTNLLTLSEPSINAKGVDIQLKEGEPGRAFTLELKFPPGFEAAQGEQVELSVKSNHPEYSNIKVPILQQPRIAPVPVSKQPVK